MTRLSDPFDEVVRNVRGAGLDAVREFVSRTYLRYGRELSPDPVFEADWDLLVVLDACRADLWTEVVADDERFPRGTTRISPAGTSTGWLEAVLGGRDPSDLAAVGYVTANPYSDTHVDGAALGHFDEVWRHAWDDDVGTAPPRPVTDAAIGVGRTSDVDRLIVHYMQPHFPSLADDRDDGIALDDFGEESLSVWENLRFGHRTVESVWSAYRENLRIVLDDVALLLSNVDADRTVVTADHGNAVGERNIYGHAAGLALRPLREVPWAVTSATDEGTHEPADWTGTNGGEDSPDVDRRLRDLGYR